MTAIVSAVIGAGLMLLALGAGQPSGIEGWTPLNESVADAVARVGIDGEGPAGKAPSGGLSADKPETNAGSLQKNAAASSQDAPVAAGGQALGNKSDTEPSTLGQSGLISINTAGTDQLQEIPGIGEKKAKAIVDYRNEHGPFKSVNELTNVKGIGEKMLEKMKPHIGL
ncbi:helix-hairpin-helix domain-containing protein [Paenibacillus sanfengchensis]|uniref:ComEA family DNA-binding protein n=1 Tax=Paenibacillus sanfengchensis TaxID=3119819 RepID=UPI002FE3106E